ncbi:Calx-beta domain-containing protein [Paractinoplanes hotanensis]|uniref:Calx-beta domain-containing protein n=1 Tax=Paractinoplanes hotanensis TaxID=2906497 RepID=A0ABT0XXI1_9ACTN|nr:Calx-beta domain-containing protein [Actinoplanes hotanensis]MCM4078432.1 hypothetical protein [Actinoplanes hotanensis]
MRYPKAHADSSGSVPFALRGPKTVRTALAAVTALGVGLVPALMFVSPASAATSDFTITPTAAAVTEGSPFSLSIAKDPNITTGTYTITIGADATLNARQANLTSDIGALSTTTIDASTAGPWTVTLPTTQDSVYEWDETFVVEVKDSTVVPAVASNTQVLTINNDDAAPSYSLSASPNPVTESAGAKTIVTASLSAISGRDTEITLNTANGTATSSNDYTALSASAVTILAGSPSITKEIPIANDGVKDQLDTENFVVNGSASANVANTGVNATSATVSIVDAQTTPKLTLSGGGAQAEGHSASFTVTASVGSELPMSVNWNSADVTPATGRAKATSGDDFTYPASRTVTIATGQTTAPISIPLTADGVNELDEDYAIELASPVNAALGTPSKATGTITDTSSAPTLTIAPSAVAEGDSGKKWATFTATLSSKSGKTVTAEWATAASGTGYGKAVAGKDYMANSGRLVFAPGATTQTFAVEIIGDNVDEGTGETFNITTASPISENPVTLSPSGPTTITITDDDSAPSVSFDDAVEKEGNGPKAWLLPVKLSNPSDHPLVVGIVDNGTGSASATYSAATPGSGDYSLLTSTVTIQPEMMSGQAVVLVNGDEIYEPDETVSLKSSVTDAPSLALISGAADDPITVTLTNDDKAPDLEINSAKGKEGETVNVTGTLTGTSQSPLSLSVSFGGGSIKGSKAADVGDFTNPGTQVIPIPAGTPSGATIPVASIPLLEDKLDEPDETIVGTGTGLGGVGTVTDGVIVITGSAGGGEEPGGEEPGEAPKPTITAPASVNGTGPVSITGTVAANATVELWGAPVAGGELKWIANSKAGTTGSYSFSRSISQGMRFVTQSQEVNSDEKTVWVNQWASLTASSPSRGRVTVLVKTNPNASGRKVVVQRWTGPNTWTNILVSRANVNGAYTATTWAPRGLVALRAWVEGDADMGINTGWTGIVRPVIR